MGVGVGVGGVETAGSGGWLASLVGCSSFVTVGAFCIISGMMVISVLDICFSVSFGGP